MPGDPLEVADGIVEGRGRQLHRHLADAGVVGEAGGQVEIDHDLLAGLHQRPLGHADPPGSRQDAGLAAQHARTGPPGWTWIVSLLRWKVPRPGRPRSRRTSRRRRRLVLSTSPAASAASVIRQAVGQFHLHLAIGAVEEPLESHGQSAPPRPAPAHRVTLATRCVRPVYRSLMIPQVAWNGIAPEAASRTGWDLRVYATGCRPSPQLPAARPQQGNRMLGKTMALQRRRTMPLRTGGILRAQPRQGSAGVATALRLARIGHPQAARPDGVHLAATCGQRDDANILLDLSS